MARKPLIGLTCSFRQEGSAVLYGLYGSYIKALENAGGLPVLIAPNLTPETLREVYDRLDGVLLTGGGDVDPALYGVPNDTPLRSLNPDRDTAEITLTQWAVENDKPLLGICRGIQVMNVARGGTLYRDIATEYGTTVDHDLGGKKERSAEGHRVSIMEGSLLADTLGTHDPAVNSLHHQAVRDLGSGFKAVAQSPDGLIEGIEFPDARFILGVQWHPEELAEYSEPMQRLFKGLVQHAARG